MRPQIWDILHDKTLPTPPDLELIINADDYGRARLGKRLLPLLSITREVGIGGDILYPAVCLYIYIRIH